MGLGGCFGICDFEQHSDPETETQRQEEKRRETDTERQMERKIERDMETKREGEGGIEGRIEGERGRKSVWAHLILMASGFQLVQSKGHSAKIPQCSP